MRRSAIASPFSPSCLPAACSGRITSGRRSMRRGRSASRTRRAKDLANTEWWEQFKDPVLNGLIKTALAENKDVKIAAARVEEYLGQYGVSRSQLFPQVGAECRAARKNRATQSRHAAPLPARHRSAVQRTFRRPVCELGNRRVGQDPPPERGRARRPAGDRGRTPRDDPVARRVGGNLLHQRCVDLDRQLEIAKSTAASRAESVKSSSCASRAAWCRRWSSSRAQSDYEAARGDDPADREADRAAGKRALGIARPQPGADRARPRNRASSRCRRCRPGCRRSCSSAGPTCARAEQKLIAANARIGAAQGAVTFPTFRSPRCSAGRAPRCRACSAGREVWSLCRRRWGSRSSPAVAGSRAGAAGRGAADSRRCCSTRKRSRTRSGKSRTRWSSTRQDPRAARGAGPPGRGACATMRSSRGCATTTVTRATSR